MRKRIRYKLLLRDLLVILFCLSGAAFFAYLFWQDLNAFTVRGDKTEIGTISFKHNVAQRKFDDRVVWERIATGTKLYYGDTIRTADLAEAVLTLADGTVLNLGENTMIQVGSNSKGGLQISISGGDIQVDSTTAVKGVELKLDDGSLVNIDAGSALAAKTDSETGVHNFEVTSGTAQVTTESGERAELSYGESVNVEKGKEIQKNAITVIYPPRELKLLNTKGGVIPVRFEWKTFLKGSVTIQTSYSRDFTKITASREIENSSTAEMRLENGVIFWRAFVSGEKENAVTGKLTVESIGRVEGISPANETSFSYRNEKPRISFRWSGNDYAERYRLLVSSTPDMKTVAFDSEINGNFTSLDLFEQGQYWWQVTPYYSMNNLGYAEGSEIHSFKINRTQDIRRPELAAPADNAQILYKENVAANFIWKSEIKDAAYDLSIARDYDFKDLVYKISTGDTRYVFDVSALALSDGTYYWKVLRKSGEADDKTPESEIRAFRLERYVRQGNKLLYPPENISIEDGKISGTAFMWKLSDEYTEKSLNAVFQVSSNPNFTKIQVERTTGSSVLDNLTLSPGDYWWRVGVRDEGGNLTGLTQSRAFTVLPPLNMPEILTPSQNQELVVYNMAPVLISWKSVEDAESYSIKILDINGKVVRHTENVKNTQIKYVLEDGFYTCQVQALATETRVSGINERIFTVRVPSSIIAQSPSDGMRIAGLTALRNPVIFTWVAGKDKVNEYKFILSKRLKGGSSKVVETITTSRTTISLNRLTEGSYSWKIVASTPSGIPLDSKTMLFTIENTPGLASARLVNPPENFVMNGSYLKKNRAIEFVWKEVIGATAYNFALYRKNADGKRSLIYSERNIKASTVRIKDLSIFEVGSFEWTVTPFSYAKDGYLEQTGTEAVGKFQIEFAVPTKVENVQPGKMYGN